MKYQLRIALAADAELKRIPVYYRRQIVSVIRDTLSTEPTKESRARIKKLIQPAESIYRLRAGDYRVFYDVADDLVTILHIRHKKDCKELYGGLPHES